MRLCFFPLVVVKQFFVNFHLQNGVLLIAGFFPLVRRILPADNAILYHLVQHGWQFRL